MKKITNKINIFISYIASVIENSVSLVGEDLVLLFFLFAGFVPSVLLKIATDMAYVNLRSLLFNLAWFCLAVGIGFKFKNNRKRITYYSILVFINFTLIYSNIMYFRFYRSFLSITLIKQLALFTKVADATQVAIHMIDIVYWSFATLFVVLLVFFTKRNKVNYNEYTEQTKKGISKNFLRMSLISFVLGLMILSPSHYSQASKLWNRPIVMENFGVYNYHVIDLFISMGSFFEATPSQTDYNNFLEYFKEKNSTNVKNEYTDMFKGKNVIVIHAESLEQFVINKEFNGREITPYFNELANQGMYFSNFYTQQSIGTSADSEFVFLSSLLPINNGTIFMDKADNTYNTTTKLLRDKGYFTIYMHGNEGSFWNRNKMYPTIGYDVFFDLNQYPHTEKQVIGLGISDYDFFLQSIQFLKNVPQPYYATLITLTNHTPFDDEAKYVTYDEYGVIEAEIDCGVELENTTACRYLKSVHYADWAFGQFMKALKAQKMLDNTIVVVYGDHPAGLPITEMEILYGKDLTNVEYRASQKVPFIIWSKDFSEGVEITKLMGEYDVAPTLQNMMGIQNPFNLGHDIFSIENNLVPFVNGDWVDDNIFYDSFEDEYFIINPDITDDFITREYINEQSEKVNIIIEMSNRINHLNLIGYYDEKNNITHVRDKTKK